MKKEILDQKQLILLDFLPILAKNFGLAGGTAIALHIGHRRSIDFDFFSNKGFDNGKIRKRIIEAGFLIEAVFVDEKDEYTVLVGGVKLTFLRFPFPLEFEDDFLEKIKMADLLTLAALKAYALGRRPKWKDYVDLYFIFKKFYSLGDVVAKAKEIFALEFNEKNFRLQLSYFDDIDYSEEVDFLPGFEVDDGEIREYLTKTSIQ